MRHKYLFGSSAFKIAEEIERAIRENILRPGDRIESVRDAATLLGVNRNTVARAYAQLRDRGLIAGQGGRGGMHVAFGREIEAGSRQLPETVCDLASGNVDPQFLPPIAPALAALDRPATGYDSAGDDPAFMASARDRLAGEGLDPRHACLTSGALDAIERCVRAQLRPGSRVLVEDPGYPPLLDLLRSLGLRLRPLALDDEGPLPASLAEGLKAGAQAVFLTPRAQNPFGCDISPTRGNELTAILDDHPEALLVLDDHWGALAEGRLTLLPNGRTRWLYIRSMSKALGPDLRIAVVLGDEMTIDRMRRQFSLGPRWVSGLLQSLAHQLWRDPQTHMLHDTARRAYRSRRDALLAAFAGHGIRAHGLSGIHVWLPVKDEAAVAQMLMGAGWAVQPGGPFRLSSSPAIRLSIGNLAVDQVQDLAKDVARALAEGQGAVPT